MRKHIHATIHHAHRVVRHLRARRILTKRKILFGMTLLNLLFLITIIGNTLSIPNLFIGVTSVGLKNRTSVKRIMNTLYQTPIKLSLNGHTYDLTYEYLGIYMDTDHATQEVFSPNRLSFFGHLGMFLDSIMNRRTINPPLSFSQDFYAYIDKVNYAGTNKEEIVYVNQENKQVSLYMPEQKYVVNTALFQDELRQHFGNPYAPITVPLTEAPSALESSLESANAKLALAYNTPLTVIVGLRNDNHFLIFSPSDLRRYTTANIAGDNTVSFAVNKEVFLPELTRALNVYNESYNSETALERVGGGLINSLHTRFDGGPAESVKVGIDYGPNTDGTLHKKYIEIDISQQKMFTFKDGQLVKTYRVSTGKDYPTPVGSFTILNKTGLGFSSIYNVWMPWWMGFSYSNKLHAYFGIHELPYFYSGTKQIQRPREFIGAPNTGGCVALDVGDAQEVYKFGDIGTPVVIYQ